MRKSKMYAVFCHAASGFQRPFHALATSAFVTDIRRRRRTPVSRDATGTCCDVTPVGVSNPSAEAAEDDTRHEIAETPKRKTRSLKTSHSAVERSMTLRTSVLGERYPKPKFSFWATVCKTVRPMLPDRCPVCLSVSLSVCNVRALWPDDWTDQDETWHTGRPRP